MPFLTETNLETNIDAARGYRRTPGNRRSKEAASATSGMGLPSASGCKDPMYQEVLSPPLLNYVQELFLCSIRLPVPNREPSPLTAKTLIKPVSAGERCSHASLDRNKP